MIRFGANPIAWSNDDDRTLGGHLSLEHCLKQAGDIGFDGIENGHKFPSQPEPLRAALDPNGLSFVSAWYSLELLERSVADEKKAIQPHLDLLKAMGCAVCVVCETSNSVHGTDTPISRRPILATADWPVFGEKVTRIAEFTAAQGIELVYHHHVGTIVQTPAEIDLLMANLGAAAKLCFDTGHCYFGGNGADPAATLKRHIDRVGHFHAKNVRRPIMDQVTSQDLTFLDGVRRGVFTVPGDPDGAIHFPDSLALLAQANYQGWLVIEAEQDPDIYDPLTYQTLGLTRLKQMAADAGLAV